MFSVCSRLSRFTNLPRPKAVCNVAKQQPWNIGTTLKSSLTFWEMDACRYSLYPSQPSSLRKSEPINISPEGQTIKALNRDVHVNVRVNLSQHKIVAGLIICYVACVELYFPAKAKYITNQSPSLHIRHTSPALICETQL